MNFNVIKRDGRKEPFSLHKLEKVINFVSEGLDVDLSLFLEKFNFTFKDGITTKEIQQNLINTANQLTYNENTNSIDKNFSIMANRLFLLDFWKDFKHNREVEYNTLTDDVGFFKKSSDWIIHIKKYVDLGVYDERILNINKEILKKLYVFAKKTNQDFENYPYQHFAWNNFYYQTLKFRKSYLIKYENKEIENFEEALLLLSILGFYEDYKKDKQLFINNVENFYKHLVNYHFIPATPQLLNLRRQGGNLSSCNVFDIYDNLESIYYSLTQSALISKNAGGIGIYGGKLRPEGSYLMNNPNKSNHTSLWFRLFNDTAIAVNQGAVRRGAMTIALPIWHLDIQEFINCRSPLGEQRYKLYDIFPQVVIPDVFFDYLKEKKDWYLIDLYEVKKVAPELDLPELSGNQLTEAYNKIVELINEGKIKHYKKVNPVDILIQIFKSLTNSGLPYITFEDNINRYSNFYEKIYSANLCVESFSPFKNTNPENKQLNKAITDDELGYMHSCNLFSLNLPRLYEDGILFDNDKLNKAIQLVVRYMDNIIDISTPPVPEIKKHNQLFRTIGIGFIGLADLLVKLTIDNNKLYTFKITKKSAGDLNLQKQYKENLLEVVRNVFGRIAFYSILNSTKLAKERCYPEGYKKTKWKDGILLGRYEIGKFDYKEVFGIDNQQDIKELETNLKEYGIRNTMLLNAPPNTSTAIYSGTTASILPAFNLFIFESQNNASYLVFPRYVENLLYYDIYSEFDLEDMKDFIWYISEVQKRIDSGISFEYPLNTNIIPTDKIPEYIYTVFNLSHRLGVKALYYMRIITSQGNTEEETCSSCAN